MNPRSEFDEGTPERPFLDAGWAVLFSSQHDEQAETEALRHQLEAWCRRCNGVDAALYSPRSQGLHRVTSVGGTLFPKRLEEIANQDSALYRVELPYGCVLLYAGHVQSMVPDSAEQVLLGAAVAIVDLKRRVHAHTIQGLTKGVEFIALYEVGLAMASILDLELIGKEILSRALMLLDCSLGAFYFLEDDEFQIASASAAAQDRFSLSSVNLDALRRHQPGMAVEVLHHARHALAVPIESGGILRGMLVVGAGKDDGKGRAQFSDNDRQILTLFANQAAIALNTARLHHAALEQERTEQDLRVAAGIQQRLLPDIMPHIPGFEVEGWNRPARAVGGDYYDVRLIAEHRWALVVGDAVGKGISAALMVSTLDSAMRLLLQDQRGARDIVYRLNNHFYESSDHDKFITMALGVLDDERRTLTYVNAGHNPGILLQADGTVQYLEAGGMPVGVLAESDYEYQEVNLQSGDLICLYSDGINECMSPQATQFGLDRLVEMLKENHGAPLNEIIDRIDHAMVDFADGSLQSDDQTVVLLRCCAS